MKKYYTKASYEYYKKFIFNGSKQILLKKYKLNIAGSVHPIDWELFGAILTKDSGKEGYGSDLQNHEVKSSVDGASFEYQYHLHGGERKLLEDMKLDHIFFSYSPDYTSVAVRILSGSVLKDKFKSWLPGLKANYDGPNRLQRYRRSISYGLVKKEGKLIMKIVQGKLM